MHPIKANGIIGLAKKAEITNIISGYNQVKITYTIENAGSEELQQIYLYDDFKSIFSNMGTFSSFNITVNSSYPVTDVDLPVNSTYSGGNEPIIDDGKMIPGTKVTVVLEFGVKLTDKFQDNTVLQSNANITSIDESFNSVNDGSNNGDTPIPGTINPTVIPLTQIVIEATGNTSIFKAATTVSETDGTITYIIKRKGYTSQTSKVYLNIAQLTGTTAATLGTAATAGVDAWRNPLTETLTFGYGETSKPLTITLVDDDMYEDNELFDVRLQTPAAQTTNKDYNNVSILIPIVKVTITSDDPIPVISVSSNQSTQITEGSTAATNSTLFTIDVTLTNTHYKTSSVNWSIPGASTAASPAGDFNPAISGTVSFPPGTKKQTITIRIQQDLVRENDKKFKISLSNPVNVKLGTQNSLEFKILDDDLRQIQWINNTPKSSSGRLDITSGIADTLDINFLVIEAPLENPKIQVKLPAGISYQSFINKIDDSNTIKVKYLSYSGNVVTFIPDGTTRLTQNQKIHFKIVRTATCSATTGSKTDAVTVIADGDPTGVEEMTDPNKIGTGARTKYANYNVYSGKLMISWKEGDNLTFSESEIGQSKKQAVTVTNSGQGAIGSFDFSVKFNAGIAILKNARIRGTSYNLTATKTTASGFDTYKITLNNNAFQQIGNLNKMFDGGEELIIEYDMESQAAKCGLKSESVWVSWTCQNPAFTLNTSISLFEPKGKPVLVRTLKTPYPILENGTANDFVVELNNTGLADAHYVTIPLSANGLTESFNINDITITLNGVPATTGTKTLVNARNMRITGLVIPSGEKAIITFPVKRTPANRYASGDIISNDFFSYIYCGDITYSDECEDPQKTGRIGYGYFNSYDQNGNWINESNLSYLPALMTTDIARIDISTDPTANKRNIAFELGSLNTIFPMYDRLNWYGGAGSKVEVTVTLTPNIVLAAATLRAGSNSDVVTFVDNGDDTYTITINYNAAYEQYFSKSGKLEMTLQGSCSGGSSINPVSYVVDFITNNSIRHKLYKKSFDVLVKCDIDPGANLRTLVAKRINYVKGDADNNGMDGGGADVAVNTGKMRLDRLYQNDTIMFEYKVKIGQNNLGYGPGCVPTSVQPWNILYATIKNIDAARLTHINSSYWVYDQNNILVPLADSVPITPTPQNTGNYYFQIDRTGKSHKFEHKDSVIIRSRWVAQTITGNQEERSDQLEFWTYCEMTARTPADIFNPRTITFPACDPLAQNYEKEYANVSYYSIATATNGARQYKYTFDTPYVPQNARYDHHLSIGYRGYDNKNFPNELRQLYYIDNIQFGIPYGYRITDNIQIFGYAPRADLAYSRYPKYTLTTPEMQGIPQNLSVAFLWDINIWGTYNSSKGQVPDEGWVVQPYIPLDVTPKAKSGEQVVTMAVSYTSPEGLPPFALGNTGNTDITQPGFILYNNAASFVLSCGAPEAIAFTDTIQWPVRITNNSSAKEVKNGWIYIGGDDLKAVKLIDRETGTTVASSGQGYQNKWLYVGTFPKETYKDYYLLAQYTKYHCDNDTIFISPWHDYKETNESPLTLYTSNQLDTTDLHVGRSVELYIVNQDSEISGAVTPLADTPKNPASPGSGLYNSDKITLGKSFPVEIILSSDDIIAVKDAGLTMYMPAGLKYVADSAYYDWKGSNTKFHPTAESQMAAINGSGTPVTIMFDDIVGAPSQLAGTYKTLPNSRQVKLRFRLISECSGFNADSTLISVRLYGNRLCGSPAIGDNDTISGRQIYLEGHRYYQIRNDIYTPEGNVFALCDDDRSTRTINISFTRIGSGELQDDNLELKIPDHFDLNGTDPVKYVDPGIDIIANPINISNTTSGGIRTITWKTPQEYSRQFTSNINVEYSVDLKLDVTAPGLPDIDTVVFNMNSNQAVCPGDLSLLSTDTVSLYIYTAKTGLAKEVRKDPPGTDGYVPLTYTYTITNYSNTSLVGIQLSDNLISMFDNMVELKDQFVITTSSTDLIIDNSYQGMGNIIQSGEIQAGTTETVTLRIWAKPTYSYDGRIFENNAQIQSANLMGCQANDISTNGLNPVDPDPDPYLNQVPTPVWFNLIRFKHNPAEFRLQESYGDLVLTIERIGQDFSPATVDIALDNQLVQPVNTLPAKLGTTNAYAIDAWWEDAGNSLVKTLQFAGNEKEKTITVHIVDDKIFELTETFIAALSNEQYLSSADILSLSNDTATVYILDNDIRPTLNIAAAKDSILEGTIPPAPFGCTDMDFVFRLTNPTYQTVSVTWQTNTAGTGVPGVDFIAQPPVTISLNPEDTIAVVKVCVIADDNPEPSATVQMEMVSGTVVNAQQPPRLADRRAMSTIIDDDLVITLARLKHLTCKGDASGLIAIRIEGGVPGTYTYEWTGPNGFTSGNDTIKNLAAGQYTVIVKDKMGTAVSNTYTVLEPAAPLQITLDQIQNAKCNGTNEGLIQTTLSGGWDSPNYTIAWTKENDPFTAATDDISSLTAGTYLLSVTDSAQCTVTGSYTVTQPGPIAVTNSVIHDVSCKGQSNGRISVAIGGGNPPYFTKWTGPNGYMMNNTESISGLRPGTYNLVIGDMEACPQGSATFRIKEPAVSLTASVDTTGNVACKGDASGMARIRTEGGWGNYKYNWSDGLVSSSPVRTGMAAGTYHVLVEDSGACTIALGLVIDEPAVKMEVTVSATDETYQNGNDGTITVTVTGGQPDYTYLWADVPALNTAYRNHLQAATYTVTVTDQWKCAITENVTITEPQTLNNLPNAFTPDGDGFNDRLLENFHIKVFDRWGYQIYEGRDGWDGKYKGKMMPAGTYFYVLIDDATGEEYKSTVLLQITK